MAIDFCLLIQVDFSTDNKDNLFMGLLGSSIKRGKTFLRSLKNLSETDLNLVSEFDFCDGSLCIIDGHVDARISEHLRLKGVEVKESNVNLEVVKSYYEQIPMESSLVCIVDGKTVEELNNLSREAGLEGYIYIPYPNEFSIIQVFEQNSFPSSDELRNPIPYKKTLPERGRKMIVFYKGELDEVVKSVKFNANRALQFRVNTIIKEGLNARTVIKRAGNTDARVHLEKMVVNKALLENAYERVELADCRLSDNGELKVEYIDGENLLKSTDAVNDTLDKIRDDLERVFDVILDYKDYSVINLDSNIDNFKRCGDRIVCFDYEWIAKPPVPISFVKFRAIHYYYQHNSKELAPRIKRNDFIKLFGYSNEDIAKFYTMERDFQAYIVGLEKDLLWMT